MGILEKHEQRFWFWNNAVHLKQWIYNITVIKAEMQNLVCFFLSRNSVLLRWLSSLTFIKRLFSSSSLSAFRVASFAYLRLLKFLLHILFPACNLSSPAFLMLWSAYRLNKQGDSRQPCCTPFSTLNKSVVPYRVLTVASWPANRFLRRQIKRSGIPISLRAFHSLSWSTQSKALK